MSSVRVSEVMFHENRQLEKEVSLWKDRFCRMAEEAMHYRDMYQKAREELEVIQSKLHCSSAQLDWQDKQGG